VWRRRARCDSAWAAVGLVGAVVSEKRLSAKEVRMKVADSPPSMSWAARRQASAGGRRLSARRARLRARRVAAGIREGMNTFHRGERGVRGRMQGFISPRRTRRGTEVERQESVIGCGAWRSTRQEDLASWHPVIQWDAEIALPMSFVSMGCWFAESRFLMVAFSGDSRMTANLA